MEELILNPDLVIRSSVANLFVPTSDGTLQHLISATEVTLDNLPEIILERGSVNINIMEKEFGIAALRRDMQVTTGPKVFLQLEDGTVYDNLKMESVSLGILPGRRIVMTKIALVKKD